MQDFAGRRLVIFGCGYVGSAVADAAVMQGMRVTALTRNASVAGQLAARGVETVVAELQSTGWHARIAPGPEYALNCVSSGGGGVEAYRRSYVEGMKSIAAWARDAAVGTMVYTGSTSVYAQGDGAVVDENSPATPHTERAALLLEAEAVLQTSTSAWRRWFILRLAGIYGPNRHFLLEQARRGTVAGRGEHRLNLIHRDDIVGAILAAFAAPRPVESAILNVADDGAAEKREVVAWLAAKLGMQAPSFDGEPAAGRRVVTPDRIIANARCKTLLGWSPRYPTFREGYAQVLGAR